MNWLHTFVLCGFLTVWAQSEKEVHIEIPQGRLKGIRTETAFHDKLYYSFKGIPYVKPNVGANKFQMPEPADTWEGVYDATKHRQPCPFYCMIKKGLVGDEDCLYLNVYSPVLDKEARKAVMVWIHPGGWNGGFSHEDLFGPDFLVENDVVLVTFNYRLGAIGFLNTEDKNAPGNAGMKDQVMALKWVKDNIHYFGGCPNRVTIFGASSGASSIQYHMMSPMSEGLFNAGIMQSGSAVNSWAITYNPRESAFMLGEALGIHTTDSAELVKELSQFHAKDIIEASQKIISPEDTANGHLFAFVPSIEADFGQDIFLPADPWTLLKSGKITNVPVMAGVVLDEAVAHAQMQLNNIELLNKDPELFLPPELNITDADRKKELGESLKKFYFGDKPASMESINEYTKMMSDVMFNAADILSYDILSVRNTAPFYEYLFSFEAPFGYMKTLFGITDGVAHGDDWGYLFYGTAFKNMPEPGSDSEKMTKVMTKMWTNFAKDNDPTSKMDDDVTIKWEPKGTDDNYLNINKELKMEKNLFKDNMDFWKGIYKDVLENFA